MEAEDHQALPLLFSCRGVIGCSGDLELSTCGASAIPNGRCSLCSADCAPIESLSGSLHYSFSPSLTRSLKSFLKHRHQLSGGGSGPGGESGFCLPAAAGAIVPSSCLCGSLSQALWPHVCPSPFTRAPGGTREDKGHEAPGRRGQQSFWKSRGSCSFQQAQ